VDLGVGEANVHVAKSQIADVLVEVGVGDATIHGTGHNVGSRGWLGRTVHYTDGPGPSRVHLEVGVGEGTVRLD
jgi:Xaa-Pro aminopeptidase